MPEPHFFWALAKNDFASQPVHTLERNSSHTGCWMLFNYLTGQLAGRLGHSVWRASPPVSTLPSPWPRLVLIILELNPHPLIGSQSQLAASMLTLLTVHFSYLPVYILILTRTRCFVMGILISSWKIGRMQSSLIYNERVTCHRSISSSWLLKRQWVPECVF